MTDDAVPTVGGDDDGTAHTFVGTGAGEPRPTGGGLAVGEVLASRYKVLRMLGTGGMGEVYAVLDAELEEEVALKLLRTSLSADASYRQRLRSEVRLARRVSHPNVCRVHDLGQHREHLFVTMELVRGRTLRALMRDQQHGDAPPMPLSAVVDVIVQLASALAAAHRAGVLHRDVKPDNLIVDDGRAVLTDFGVASLAGEGGARVIAGTPAYVAPEVLRGEPFDHRADVYATAVVAYELIAGALPFPARTMDEALRRALARPPPPPLPSAAGPAALRAALEQVIHAGLDWEPARRTSSVDRLAEQLAAAAVRADAGEVVARGAPMIPQPSEATPTTTSLRRPELRVATVVVFHCDALVAGGETIAIVPVSGDADPGAHTQIVPVELPGEDLERLVVGLGGLPLAIGEHALTALFGAPVALGDDAVRAVRAARALVERTIGGRAGVDTLRVMVRPGAAEPVGPEAQRLAAALAAAAPAGDVWLSAAAARQVAAHVEVAPVDDVAGQRAARVIGDGRATTPSPASRVRPRELARLEALARACFEERVPSVVEIRGPAGAGKTRLREALVARIGERREVDWLIARAAPLGEAAPLSLLRTADPAWAEVATRGGADRAATLVAARRWLETRANRRPVAVVFEDLQWADELSRALVAHLASNLDRVPVLVVTTARDDGTPPLPGAHGITLEPLDDRVALALAREAAPGVTDDALADVVARAGGNPYFVEELARELAERGPGLLPATVEAAVQGRIDRLGGAAADVLAAGAVVGRAFWREAARAALPAPLDDAALDAALVELERRGLCHPAPPAVVDDDRYEFAQAVVRDVAYQRLPPRDRRRAHASVATWLEAQRSADPDLLLALAHHRELGGDRAGAAASWRQAGARCLELYAYRQAHAALARAAELAEPDAELLELLGAAALESDSADAAEAALTRALALAGDAARPRLYYKLGQAASARADHARAIRQYEAGLALVAGDVKQEALLTGALGWVLAYQLSSPDPRGLALCERAVELLEGTAHRRELAHALSRLGGAYMRAGRWSEQLRCNQRNLAIAQELADLAGQITARINLGVVHVGLGDVDLAIEHTEVALALCRRTGARATEGLACSNLAGCLLERGDLDAAERRLAEAVPLLERTGSRRVLPETRTFAARIAARRGDLDGAAAAAHASIALSRELGIDLDVAVGLRVLAQIEARRGAPAAALLDEATALTGDDPFERARLDAARFRIAGDRAARDRAADVLARLGATLDLAALDDPTDVR